MKLYIHTAFAFSFLFFGALGRAFKSCSKADDIAHVGSYAKNLEHLPHNTNIKSLGRYATLEASVIKDPVALQRYLELTEVVDRRVLEDLAMTNNEVKIQLKTIDEKFLPSEKMKEYGKLIEKYIKNIDPKNYEELFRTLHLASKVKEMYALDGNIDQNKFDEKTKDFSIKKKKLTVNIPDGYYELSSVTNPFIDNIWINDKSAIFIYSFHKNYEKTLEEWKLSKQKNNLHLNVFAEKEELITFKVSNSKNEELFGFVKVLKDGDKVLFIETIFKHQVYFLKEYKALAAEI